jgi:hypothetical protein
VLPFASVAVHITVVDPSGKALGALLLKVIVPLQLSVAVGVPILTPVAVQLVLVVVLTVAGQEVIVGLTLSVTITV